MNPPNSLTEVYVRPTLSRTSGRTVLPTTHHTQVSPWNRSSSSSPSRSLAESSLQSSKNPGRASPTHPPRPDLLSLVHNDQNKPPAPTNRRSRQDRLPAQTDPPAQNKKLERPPPQTARKLPRDHPVPVSASTSNPTSQTTSALTSTPPSTTPSKNTSTSTFRHTSAVKSPLTQPVLMALMPKPLPVSANYSAIRAAFATLCSLTKSSPAPELCDASCPVYKSQALNGRAPTAPGHSSTSSASP